MIDAENLKRIRRRIKRMVAEGKIKPTAKPNLGHSISTGTRADSGR